MPPGASSDIQVVIKAIDQFSAAMLAFEKSLKGQQAQAANTEKAIGGLSAKMGAFATVMQQGIGQGIGQKVFDALSSAVEKVLSVIPDLINRGHEWASLVEDLQRITGMTAEQTSTLAAIFQHLGMDTSMLDRTFAIFGKNLATNEKLFAELGIATRDSNGKLLDAYSIITNTRRAFQAHGQALTTTGAAQELFSRSGYKMLEFLQLTDEQFQALAVDAANAGVVLDQTTVDAAERMTRTWAGLWQTLNGLAVQVFAALEPSLAAFVASFSAWIRQNLDAILRFVVTVVNFVMGLIGGLLGIDFAAQDAAAAIVDTGDSAGAAGGKVADFGQKAAGAAKGEDALTKSIKAQIAAIDAQIAAIDKRKAARDASEQEADLEKAIADAEKELADLQASALNTYGLSGAEKIKAEQKRQSDILSAQQKVADAQKKMAEWQADVADDAAKSQLENLKKQLQEQLKLHSAAQRAITAGVAKMGAGIRADIGGVVKDAAAKFDKFRIDAAKALAAGRKFAEDLKAAIGRLLDRISGGVAVLDWVATQWDNFWRGVKFIGSLIGVLAAGIRTGWSSLHGFLVKTTIRILSTVAKAVSGILGAFSWLLDRLRSLPLIGQFIPGGSSAAPTYTAPTFSSGTADEHDRVDRETGGLVPFGVPARVGEAGIEDIDWTPRGIQVTPRSASGSLPPIQLIIDGRVLMEWIDVQLGRRQPVRA